MPKKQSQQDIALEALGNIGQAVVGEMDLPALLELIYQETSRVIPMDCFVLGLHEPERDTLRFEPIYDQGERLEPVLRPREEGWGHAGRVLEERATILLEDVGAEELAEEDLLTGKPPRSWLGVPLVARERILGVLLAQSYQAKAFNAEDRRLLEAIAGQAAMAIADYFYHREHERRIAELAVLSEISRAVSSALDLDQLLETVYRQAGRVVDTTNFYIALYDAEKDEVVFVFDVEGEKRRPRASRKAGQGLTEFIMRSRQPLLLRENVTEWIAQELGVEQIGKEACSWLGVPLMIGERVLGMMAVQSYTTSSRYDEQDLALLSTIAAHTAVAVENAYLYEQARSRAEEMGTLFTVSRTLAASLVAQETWRAIFEAVLRVAPYETIEACLYDERQQVLRTVMEGTPEGYGPSSGETYHLGEGLSGWIAQTRQPLLIADVNEETTAQPKMEHFAGLDLRAFLGVPMLLGERLIGTLEITSSEAGQYSEHHVDLLASVAAQAAVAVERARLFSEARGRAEEMAVLNELGQALTARLNVEQVVEEAYRQANRLIDTTNFYIALYDSDKDEVTFVLDVIEGQVRKPYSTRRAGRGLTEYLIRSRQPLFIPQNVDERLEELGIEQIGPVALSWLGVPLLRADRVLGVMAVQSYTTASLYTERERDLLTSIASQASIAIENARLFEETQRALEEVRAASERQQQLLDMVQELSTPLVPITDEILALPLVGTIDSLRAQRIMEVLLQGVASRRARVVILDITGVPVVDTSVANHLLQATRSVRLLGAECIVVGITSEVAQTIVGLGIELRRLVTRSDLQGGVEYALQQVGKYIAG